MASTRRCARPGAAVFAPPAPARPTTSSASPSPPDPLQHSTILWIDELEKAFGGVGGGGRLDLPNVRERAAIWEIVVGKFGRDPSLLDAATMAKASERHTGAEIEAAYV